MQESYPTGPRPSTEKTTGKTGKSPTTDPGPRPTARYAPDWLDHIPADLRGLKQWVVWRYELDPDGKRWTKILYRPASPSKKADATDPFSWSDLPTAVGAYLKGRDLTGPKRIDGIGFVFSPDDPYVGVDFDNCLDADGAIVPWAYPHIMTLETYGEISPSGRGVKFIAKGQLPGKGRRKTGIGPDKTGAVEMYDQARFFTITGNQLDGQPATIEDLSEAIVALHDEVFPPKPKPARPRVTPPPLSVSDQDLLTIARNARNGAGERFASLFDYGNVQGGKTASEADLALCNFLAFYWHDEASVDRMFRQSRLYRDKWERADYRALTIGKALDGRTEFYSPPKPRASSDRPTGDAPPIPSTNGDEHLPPNLPTATAEAKPPERPPIFVTTEEHEVNDQAVAALALDLSVYHRGFMLTTVRRGKVTTKGIIRPAGCPQIAPLPLPGLRERLAKHAVWLKSRKTRDGESEAVPTHPPDWSVSAVAARGEWPSIRPLEAVIEAPVLRYDGTILDVPGYDPDTALLYEPNGRFPAVKARPTLADAKAAAARLLDLVADFPFANDSHRAAWLAALLTPLSRFAIAGPCPLFLFDATAAGSGKSMLCDIISFISTGREMARTDYPDCNEEMRKTITAVALAGDPMMLLDNVATTFGCSALDSALTARTWKNRILGRSEMTPELPLFTVWFATGNNVGLRGDVMRRIIPCRLEPKVDRPEERTDFKRPKLMRHVQDNRPALVADVLTITRAYFAAGRPDHKLTPLGSFDEWSAVVRSAVVWTIGDDPCKAREDLRAADDTASNAAAIIEGWDELTSTPGVDKKLTAAQALKELRDHPTAYTTLREAIMSWSRNDELPSQRAVGMRLNSMRGKVVSGKYMHGDQLKGTWLWSVGTVHPGGTSGTSGTYSNPSRQNCDDNCNTKSREIGANKSHQSNQSHPIHSCGGCLRMECRECNPKGSAL